MRLVGVSGSLCSVDDALVLDHGELIGLRSAPSTGDALQTCKIRLVLTVPPGRKFEAPSVCSTFHTTLAGSRAALTLTYATPGRLPVHRRLTVDSQTADATCHELDWSAAACRDRAIEVPVTIEVAARLEAGDSLDFTGVNAAFSEDMGTTWSSCPPKRPSLP